MRKTKNRFITKAAIFFFTAAMLLCQPFSFLGLDRGVREVVAADTEWKTHYDPSQPFDSVESEHFRILYGKERPANKRVQITDEMLQGNLEHLEAIRDFYINEIGMRDIGGPAISWWQDGSTKYKCNIYISGTGLGRDGWAFVNVEHPEDGAYAYAVFDQDSMSVSNPQSTVLPHELAHVFVSHQKGALVWDWNEPVADFLRNEWQKNAGAFKDGPNTVDFGIFAQNTEWRYPSEKKWYEIWPILTYIYENPDKYQGLGKQAILKLLQDSKTDDKSYYHKMERVMGVEIEKILCGTVRRLVTMDFDKQELYQGTLNRVKKDMFTSLEDAGDGWQKVSDSKMPQQTGFNIIPLTVDLKKSAISVELYETGSSANAGHTASIVTVTESGDARYSDMWHDGVGSIKLRGDEKNAYLVVVATPKELESITVYNPDGSGVDKRDTERYPYKVKITQNDEIDNGIINIAPQAMVKADYSNTDTSTAKVNDKELAGDSSKTTWNTWCKDGNKEYPYPIAMEWDEKQSIAGMKIMWWADDAEPGTSSGDGVLFPESCQAEYYDEEQGTWKPIKGMTDETGTSTDSVGVKYGTDLTSSANAAKYLLGKNRYWNEVKFAEEIETTKLRLRIGKPDNADKKSGIGIGEWQVISQYNIAPDAEVKADYSNTDTSTNNVNDKKLAWHSPKATWNTWCKDGNKEYPYPVTMEWDEKQSLSSMKVMWWADDAEPGTSSGDGVLFPKSCRAEYYDEEQGAWKAIKGMTDETGALTDSVGVKYGTGLDSSTNAEECRLGNNRYWNEVKFAEKIETTKLRLYIDKPDNTDKNSGIGIGEWQVYGETAKSQTTPEQPDPEKPDPEKPDPEQPDPEKPDPEQPDPEKPDPETPSQEELDQKAAEKVKDLIDQIGTVTLTETSKEKITAAREEYKKLTESQKKLVTNISVLEEKEREYQKLEEEAKNSGKPDLEKPDPGTPGEGTELPKEEDLLKGNPELPQGGTEESAKAKFSVLTARVVKSKNTSNQLKWKKVKGAQGYIVFGNMCNVKGKKYEYKVLKITDKNSTTSYTHKKLKKGTYYKYIVQAYKMVNGKPQIIATSKTMHAAMTGGKYGNAGSIRVNKSKMTLKKGKKFTIKAKEVKKYKKPKRHRKIAYESSNPKVATVSAKGVVKAKKKGSCYVYVYAQNGVYKRIKVKVK